jgi:hypothetical protein
VSVRCSPSISSIARTPSKSGYERAVDTTILRQILPAVRRGDPEGVSMKSSMGAHDACSGRYRPPQHRRVVLTSAPGEYRVRHIHGGPQMTPTR